MRKFLTIINIIIINFAANAQQKQNQPKLQSDSIISVFEKTLKNINATKTELIKNPNNYYIEYPETSTDTIFLENYENFKFFTIKKADGLTQIDFTQGKVSQLFEKEQYTYYFDTHSQPKLLLTQVNYIRHGEQLEDYGYSIFQEERRLLFSNNGQPMAYLIRECEGSSSEINISIIPFKTIDTKNVFYDKSEFENLGFELLNGNYKN